MRKPMIYGSVFFGPQITGDHMTHYIIYFNQQWVGDHSEEWFQSRGPLARAVVAEMKEAGVLIFAAGVDEDLSKAFSADETSGELHFGEGRYSNVPEYLGGFTVVDVSNQESAKVLGRQARNGLWLATRGPTTPCMTTAGHGAEKPSLRHHCRLPR
jgi:hypothetical protein